ncbi:MAG: hypothetical protein ACE3JK_08190 [Sporolactobacillus sp.]
MSEEINHEVIGKLYYQYGWVKEIKIEMMGKKRNLQVVIDAEEDADFEDIQIKAYKKFFANIESIVKDAEEAIFRYYQIESPKYRTQLNESDTQKRAPKIENIAELYPLVTPKQFIFPMVFEGKREAGFLCDCLWEIEHGVGVKFENEKITEVGFQDILL